MNEEALSRVGPQCQKEYVCMYIILRNAERILDHFLASDYFGKRKYVCIYIYIHIYIILRNAERILDHSSRLIISENVNMYVCIYIYIILRKAERIFYHFLASDYFGKRKTFPGNCVAHEIYHFV